MSERMPECIDLVLVEAELGAYMARVGMGKGDVAAEMGVTPRSLQNKLSGITEFKASELAYLRRVTGRPLDDFFAFA